MVIAASQWSCGAWTMAVCMSAPITRPGTAGPISTSGTSYAGYRMDLNFWVWSVAPLEVILEEVERALAANLYYLALHLAVAIPDICSSLEESPDPAKPWKGVEQRYVDWCERYLEHRWRRYVKCISAISASTLS